MSTAYDDQISRLQEGMEDKGMDPDTSHELISEVLDALIDWTRVLPGPAGVTAEAMDGPVWAAILDALEDAIHAVGKLFERRTKGELLGAALEAERDGKTGRARRLRRRAARR